MRKAVLVVLFALALPLSASTFRLFNPTAHDLQATLTCGESSHSVNVAAGAIVDTECRVSAPEEIVVLATDGEQQRLVPRTTDISCADSVTVGMPLSGCRLGSATASVTPVNGATYAWSVTNGSIA